MSVLEIDIEIKYPEKFLDRLSRYAVASILLSKSKYPMGKKAGKFENKFFHIIFTILAFCFTFTYLPLSWFFGKVYKR